MFSFIFFGQYCNADLVNMTTEKEESVTYQRAIGKRQENHWPLDDQKVKVSKRPDSYRLAKD